MQRILTETTLTPAAHLTCVAATRQEVDSVIRDYWDAGVRHIVALRGDPPGQVGGAYVPPTDGYANATELTAAITRIAPFEISVGCYPEKHPESPSIDHDIDVLKAKVDAGATRAITQVFFENDTYLRFLDKALAAGITAPIVPGIMPVSNFKQAANFCAACGTSVPKWMESLFEGLDDDIETRRMVAAATTAEQVRILQANGIDEFHFYTLNRADLVYAIARILGVKPKTP